jgi:hypothetical protein
MHALNPRKSVNMLALVDMKIVDAQNVADNFAIYALLLAMAYNSSAMAWGSGTASPLRVAPNTLPTST